MTRAALRLALSAAFLASALLKALDFDATAALFADAGGLSPAAGRALVGGAVLLELALAGAIGLRLGPRRLVHGAALALLAALSLAAAGMWLGGWENCGCFGTRFQVGPAATLAKNAALFGAALLLFRRDAVPAGPPP